MGEGEPSIIKRKAGRPSLSSSHQTSEGINNDIKFQTVSKGFPHNLPSTW